MYLVTSVAQFRRAVEIGKALRQVDRIVLGASRDITVNIVVPTFGSLESMAFGNFGIGTRPAMVPGCVGWRLF